MDAKLSQDENCLLLAGLSPGHGREGLELRTAFQRVGRSGEPVLAWETPTRLGRGPPALGYILRDRYWGNWNETHSCLELSEPKAY